MNGAARQWQAELAAWRIDEEILAMASESPYRLPPELFCAADAPPGDTPSRRRAREALPDGGTVLDVGCGGGAAGLALVPPAGRVDGVDESAEMLGAFAAAADARGVEHREVRERWPDVAPMLAAYDVVVCHHVAYNVAELGVFAQALGAHARHRVVLELTASHPWTGIGPLWRAVHGQDRPWGPTAALAQAVLAEAGIDAVCEWAERPHPPRPRALIVASTRRRLCLPVDREPEVDALLPADPDPPPTRVATLWWDTARDKSAP